MVYEFFYILGQNRHKLQTFFWIIFPNLLKYVWVNTNSLDIFQVVLIVNVLIIFNQKIIALAKSSQHHIENLPVLKSY